MVKQEYGINGFTGKYSIIGNSTEQINRELTKFVKEFGTEDNEIWIYINPVRPSNINLRPEYSMEVIVKDKKELLLMFWYQKVWG